MEMYIPQAARRFGLSAAKRINCRICTVFPRKNAAITHSNKAHNVVMKQKIHLPLYQIVDITGQILVNQKKWPRYGPRQITYSDAEGEN